MWKAICAPQKKANIPKKQLKTKIPGDPPGSTKNTVVEDGGFSDYGVLAPWSPLAPSPVFVERLGKNNMELGVFFSFFSHHSFTSLFSDFDFKKAVGCVFNGLFFDRRFAVVSWFGGLLNSGWGGFLPFIALSWCFIQCFFKYFEVQTTASAQSKARGSRSTLQKLPKELCFCFCAKVGLHWSRNHKIESNTNMAATFLSSRP